MSDLATLGLAIDSRQVTQGVDELDKLTAAGGRAEKAIDRLGDEAQQTGSQVKTASAQAADYAANVQRMANNTRLTGTHVETLGKASLAARANVAVLGTEIGNLAGGLATGSMGADAMAGSLGRLTLASGIGLAALGSLAVIAASVGAAFLSIKMAAEEADPKAKNLIATLGLTAKEIEKLDDTSVTWGDTFGGVLDTIAQRMGTTTENLKAGFTDVFKFIVNMGKTTAQILLAAFAASIKGVVSIWGNLPGIIGNAAVGAANLAIGAFEKLINLGIAGINALAAGINNSLLGKGLKMAFGVELPQLANVSLGRIQKQFSGSFSNIAADVSGQFKKTFSDVDRFLDDSSFAADARRDARLVAQADELIADRTPKVVKAHKERAKAAKEEADAWDKLVKSRENYMLQGWDVSDNILKANDNPGQMDVSLLNSLTTLVNPAEQLLEQLRAISDQSQVTAQVMQDAFGNVGGVFGSIIENQARYMEAQQYWANEIAKDASKQGQAERALGTLRIKNAASAISGIKSLFSEHSKAYKIMSAVEKAFAVWQAAETIASMARDITKTASSVANSAARATAAGTEGVATQSKLPFPLNLVAMAATAAALIAAGVAIFGGGGGGSGSTPPTSAQDLQDAAGTGSILGDSKAKSDSIRRSLEIVAANTNKDLEYTNQMLKALRSIDFGISKLAGTVARQIGLSGGLFDTSNQNLGTNSSGGFLGLFGSTTTRSLYDLGITLNSGSVADIIANGIAGQTYQVIEKVKKKKGFLGIGSSTKTTYITTTGQIDPEITEAIQTVITSLRDGLLSAADVIGLEGAQAILDAFQVNIGKISFKDMTGQEIEDQLNAIFSKIGDDMAGAVFPTLKQMQLVGEGLFETFIRVAKEYQAVDTALKSIGRTFGATGVESVAARDALVQLFGGLDEFLESTDFFRDQFLTEAEQIAPIASAVRDEMARLGLAGITTRDQFKQAVLGLDLTTAAGREMYAALLAVAPAFDKVLDYAEQAKKAQIDDLQSSIDQFTKFAESLKKYRDTLFQTDAAQGNAYARLRAQFTATAALAATGDATALGGLENAGRSFLEAARNNASSREQYLRDVALVARGVDQGIFAAETTADYAQLQLEALENATSILTDIATNTAVTADALKQNIPVLPAVAGGQPAPGQPPVPTPGEQTIIDQNATIIGQNGQLVSLLTEQQRFWRRVEGEGMLIRGEEDTPVFTSEAP